MVRTVLAALLVLAAPAAAEPVLTFGDLSVEVSGHVNLGILHYRDGATSRTWAPVDNDHSSSRARIEAVLDRDAFELLARLEIEYQPRPSDAVSIADGGGWDWSFGRGNIRLLETGIEHDTWGTLWLGQGDMASEDVVEGTDLSGTAVAAEPSVEDLAAAQVFRLTDGTLSPVSVGDAFETHDGLGRAVRIRYDTPRLAGFQASAAYGQDRLAGRSEAELVDLALRYEAERGEAEWKGALGIGWEDGERVLSGAVSGLHMPTGISLTLGAGERDSRFGWVKLGWQRDLVDAGRTHLSLDHWRGADHAEDGSRSRSWGLAAVQALDARNAELWLVLRRFELRDGAAYRPGRLAFGGVRISF